MNASSVEKATDIDYFITNVKTEKVTAEWLVTTYSQRNWSPRYPPSGGTKGG